MRIAAASLVAAFSFVTILTSCGETPRPAKPFILTDRGSIGFGTEFASGTFVGTSVVQSLTVTNEGLEDLKITSVVLTGDNEFTFRLQGENTMPSDSNPLVVKPAKNTFVEFTFAPMAVDRYRGALNIKSNADNVADLTITLTGCGIRKAADGGTSEQPDGGC